MVRVTNDNSACEIVNLLYSVVVRSSRADGRVARLGHNFCRYRRDCVNILNFFISEQLDQIHLIFATELKWGDWMNLKKYLRVIAKLITRVLK